MAKQEETQSLLEESSYVRVLGPPSSTSQDRNSVSTPKITADGVDSISLCQINGESFTNTNSTSMDDNFELHMSFLTGVKRDTGSTRQDSRRDEIRTTPLFSGPILGQSDDGLLPQYGLIAERIQDYDGVAPRDYLHEDLPIHTSHLDPRIFLNVNAPWSTFICGSQGKPALTATVPFFRSSPGFRAICFRNWSSIHRRAISNVFCLGLVMATALTR